MQSNILSLHRLPKKAELIVRIWFRKLIEFQILLKLETCSSFDQISNEIQLSQSQALLEVLKYLIFLSFFPFLCVHCAVQA